MDSSQNALSSDQRSRRDFIRDISKERRASEQNLVEALSRLSSLEQDSSDQRIGIVPEDSAGVRPVEPSDQASLSCRTHFKTDQFASDRPSLRRRISRSLARFFIAALIGAGVTLTWQSYGDQAKESVRTRVPSVAWLLPGSSTKSSPDGQVMFKTTLSQQLKPMAIDLAVVRRSVDELTAQQNQIVQSLAALQAVEQDLRQKMSPPPLPRPAPNPQRNGLRVATPQPASRPPSQAVPMPSRNNASTAAAPEPSAESSSVR